MAKSKDSFEAIIEVKVGRGKKATTYKIPVVVKFSEIPSFVTVDEEALWKLGGLDRTEKVLNKKELRAAYKAWSSEQE